MLFKHKVTETELLVTLVELWTEVNQNTSVILDATGHTWIASMWIACYANYNFNIHYKHGKTNVDADALSRFPEIKVQNKIIKSTTAEP